MMDSIRNRMISAYGYDPGVYEGYINETDNNKLLAKLDWNVNEHHNATLRWNYLDAKRDQGPHPFVLSFNNTGRGPNESTLPFQKSGYAINNNLNSFAFELNSRSTRFSNRFTSWMNGVLKCSPASITGSPTGSPNCVMMTISVMRTM